MQKTCLSAVVHTAVTENRMGQMIRSVFFMTFSLRKKFDIRVEATGHRSPSLLSGILVIQVHYVDFLHLAPFHAFTVKVGNAVGG